MKTHIPTLWLASAVWLLAPIAVKAVDSLPPRSEDVVHRYLKELLEDRNLSVVEEIVQPDCVMHRPETELKGIPAIRAFFERSRQNISEMHADVHDVIASGDRVVIRLSHRAVGAGSFKSRVGTFDIKGKTFSWDAIAIFRIKEGKIAEEWVNRDELGILLGIGAVQKKE